VDLAPVEQAFVAYLSPAGFHVGTRVPNPRPDQFVKVTRTGGTDYTSSDFAPLNSFSNITNYIQTTNPATSNPWAVSDFSATGFNVGEETKP